MFRLARDWLEDKLHVSSLLENLRSLLVMRASSLAAIQSAIDLTSEEFLPLNKAIEEMKSVFSGKRWRLLLFPILAFKVVVTTYSSSIALPVCRDMWRSAKLVLIEALQAAKIPCDSLADLFESDRNSFANFFVDIQVLKGFLQMHGDILEAKLRTIERINEFYCAAHVPKTNFPEQPLVSPLAAYERNAYLSYVTAIQKNPSLASKSLQKAYDWIKEHGVTLDGNDYDPPEFPTWQKYRSLGERKAKAIQPPE